MSHGKALDAYITNRQKENALKGVEKYMKDYTPNPLLDESVKPPVKVQEGVLYIRPGRLGMPTICPASMSWLLYLRMVQTVFPEFGFETEYINDNIGVPRFVTAEDSYDDLEKFGRTRRFSLEPRRTDVQDIEKQRKEQDILNTIDERKQIIKEHLVSMENSFLYGCSLLELPETDWLSDIVQQRIITCDNVQQVQEELMTKMEVACQTLSDLLGDNGYYMDDLRDSFYYYETGLFGKGRGTTSVTTVDVETAAISMLIMKCFENAPEVPFNSALKDKLNWHISLWAQGDRLYSFYMKHEVQVYSSLPETTAVLTQLLEGPCQASGKSGLVYKVRIEDQD